MTRLLFCFLILFISCKNQNDTNFTINDNDLIGKVVKIKDGDSFEILINGKTEIVRLHQIDCPEKRQAFGNKAKQFASDLCFGKEVIVRWDNNRDQYNRILGEVFLKDGTNINLVLVENGMAWHFKRYSSSTIYADAEQMARKNKLGLWQDPNPTPPWEWRKNEKKYR